MGDKGIGKRLREIEECIARPKCEEYNKFFDCILDVLNRCLNNRLSQNGLNDKVRERFYDHLWPDRNNKKHTNNFTPPMQTGRVKAGMSRKEISLALVYGRADRDDLQQGVISPLVSAMRQALSELVEDEELRSEIEVEIEEGMGKVLNRFRQEK